MSLRPASEMGRLPWASGVAILSLAFALWSAGRLFLASCGPGLWAAVLLAMVLLIAGGGGRALLGGLGLSDVSDSQKTLIGCTLGLGVLSLGVFALAAAGALYLGTAFALLALVWVLGFTQMRAIGASLASNRSLLSDRPLAAAAVLAGFGLSFWTAWIPPHQYDSLVYHLPLAAAAVREHRLAPLEGFVYTHFPQNGEMLFALALLLKSDLLAQLLMWLAGLLSAWWIFEMGRREAPLSAVLLACFLLATHTSAMLLCATTYVEPLVMLWTTAAVLSFLRWEEVSEADDGRRSWLVLSALFTGLALGTKYYAGITAALLGLALLARAWGRRSRHALADFAAFTGVVAVLFAPWLVKNWLAIGNPVFPFLNGLFPGAREGWTESISRGYFNALTEYRHVGSFWGDWLSLPLLLLTGDLRFGRGADVLGGLGWELVFWFLPLAVWAAWNNRFLRRLLLFCAAYLACWLATGVVLRFLIVILPLLCLLVGCGLHALWGRLSQWGRAALAGAVGALTATHLLLFLYVQGGVLQGLPVLLGLEDRQDYLARRLDYYPCARAAREQLGENDRILLVGEQRSYYLEQPHRATTVHGPNPALAWADQAADPAALAARLRQEGFSAVLVTPREAARLGEAAGTFSEKGLKNWLGLEPKHLSLLFRGPACSLYSLRPPAGS